MDIFLGFRVRLSIRKKAKGEKCYNCRFQYDGANGRRSILEISIIK